MRTINFRIWNGMKMVYDITSGKFGTFYVNPENGDGLNPKDTASLTVNTTKYHEGTPLMQFTGIHDCNSKPIYEGDIIRAGVRTMFVIFKQEACQFWLIWTDGKINRYEPISATYGDGDYYSNDSLEVIGNIYEKP